MGKWVVGWFKGESVKPAGHKRTRNHSYRRYGRAVG